MRSTIRLIFFLTLTLFVAHMLILGYPAHAISKNNKSSWRYFGENEKKYIEKHGKIPNKNEDRTKKTIFITKKKYETAGRAEKHLNLQKKPVYGVSINQKNLPKDIKYTRVKKGGGNEATGKNAIPVNSKKIYKLKGGGKP